MGKNFNCDLVGNLPNTKEALCSILSPVQARNGTVHLYSQHSGREGRKSTSSRSFSLAT